MVWWCGLVCLVMWFGLVVWWCGGLVVWFGLFGGVAWFGGLAVWRFGGNFGIGDSSHLPTRTSNPNLNHQNPNHQLNPKGEHFVGELHG